MSKLTLMIIAKNEEKRYLKEMLEHASSYVDEIVAMDDNSNDGTYDILADNPKTIRIIRNTTDQFTTNESVPRYHLFLETSKTNPDWIIALDSDEIMEDKFGENIHDILDHAGNNQWFSIEFYHFWNSRVKYRVDKLWKPSRGIRIFKYNPIREYIWLDQSLHCGSIPRNIIHDIGTYSGYRVKHLGYAGNSKEIERKYNFYIQQDPKGKMCPLSHYQSMLDPNPVLQMWKE